MRFDASVCKDLDQASQREWLETNGLGGYASGTIAGVPTRRYHGLLMAALKPPVARTLLLSKFEETLIADGERFELGANLYPGVVHPAGYQYLRQFELNPWPEWTFEVDDVVVRKRVFMVHGENTTVVEYELEAGSNVHLELRPMIAFRDFNSLTHRNDALRTEFGSREGIVTFQPYPDMPQLHLAHNAETVDGAGVWYHRFEYDRERERGLDFEEDLFNPCVLRFVLASGRPAQTVASTEVRASEMAEKYRLAEQRRRKKVEAQAPANDSFAVALTAAADHYIVKRGDLHTVIAGYHWFSDWGRDTMIALPGLTLSTGRYNIANEILLAFAKHLSQGMLPNRFPDAGEEPEYNTVDATLWFFEAIRALTVHTGDLGFVRTNLYEALKDVLQWHLRGTRYGIQADVDGLLNAGQPGVQLTWMDARVGDWVVTPRNGKAVEIQALWYNALRTTEALARTFKDDGTASELRDIAELATWSFNTQFWNPEARCLYDVVEGDRRDASMRPNQIFAVSLHHSMLSEDRMCSVVAAVERDLVTPMGLRSLAPSDPSYRPTYCGGVFDRDSAYHQGTVWPWLMGPFITAHLRAHGDSRTARDRMLSLLRGFEPEMNRYGLGHIAEIADGEAPHSPRGCIAQAWSIAELLRAFASMSPGSHRDST